MSEEATNNNLKWYVIHAYSGFELKVKQMLEERIRNSQIADMFGEVVVPQESVSEVVSGERKEVKKKFFPGYILVQMVLNEDSWHLVKETPKVASLLSDAPLAEAEVERILNQVQSGVAATLNKGQFEQGDTVVVVDGPFLDFKGTVEEVRPEKGKIRVLISIFGRNTPVELNFVQVEKC
jgi:transcriptional antiterminator NusG